ncbi:hypothetical protein ACWTU6_11130 [Mesorhizobium sp. BHbsci]
MLLTGLSASTVREWASRRALIPAHVPPKSQGSAAQYSWQIILLLRIAITLRNRFSLQLQAHRPFFASLRRGPHDRSYSAIWDRIIALYGGDEWVLVDDTGTDPLHQDALIVLLNLDLAVISKRFALPKPTGAAGQLDLFPTTAVGQGSRRPARPTRQVKADRSRRFG